MSRKKHSSQAKPVGPAPASPHTGINVIDWKRIGLGLAIWAAVGIAFYLLAL